MQTEDFWNHESALTRTFQLSFLFPEATTGAICQKKTEYHVLGSKAVHVILFWIIYSYYQSKV